MKQILMDGFSGILDTGQVDDNKMMKDKLIDGKELQIGLEVANGNKFDECSISPKIGQILLH